MFITKNRNILIHLFTLTVLTGLAFALRLPAGAAGRLDRAIAPRPDFGLQPIVVVAD